MDFLVDYIFKSSAEDFLTIYVALSVIVFSISLFLVRVLTRDTRDILKRKTPTPSKYEIALFAGGKERIIHAVIASLLHQKLIEFVDDENRRFRTVNKASSHDAFENRILKLADTRDGVTIKGIEDPLLKEIEVLEEKIVASGLGESIKTHARAIFWPTAIYMSLLGIGVVRAIAGILKERPVAYLMFLLIANLFLMFRARKIPKTNQAGKEFLYKLKRQNEDMEKFSDKTDDVGFAVALHGCAAAPKAVKVIVEKLLPKDLNQAKWGSVAAGTSAGLRGGVSGCGG